MATGTLGQADIPASTNTVVYTVPTGSTATFNINLVNRGSAVVAVRIAVAATSNPTDAEYLEYDWPLGVGDVLERTGIVASENKNIVVYSTAAGVSANAHGYEV